MTEFTLIHMVEEPLTFSLVLSDNSFPHAFILEGNSNFSLKKLSRKQLSLHSFPSSSSLWASAARQSLKGNKLCC